MDSYSPRQLCALLSAALCAPVVTVCSAVSWHWVLLGAAVAGLFLLYIVWAARSLPPHMGVGDLMRGAWGGGGTVVALLSWLWLALSGGLAASMAVTAFPQDNAFPLIPLVLIALAALAASKGCAAACRFGATLFLAVAALLAAVLAFGAADIRVRNLMPVGEPAELAKPVSVLLLPAAAIYLRDGLTPERSGWGKWYLLTGVAAAAVSAVCVGALGLPLAKASANAFWLMSRSISVLGVMERFETVISAMLAISFCCLLAFLFSAAQKTFRAAVSGAGEGTAVWGTAVVSAAALWVVPRIPQWGWFVGNLLFWGLLPSITLLVVQKKKVQK